MKATAVKEIIKRCRDCKVRQITFATLKGVEVYNRDCEYGSLYVDTDNNTLFISDNGGSCWLDIDKIMGIYI